MPPSAHETPAIACDALSKRYAGGFVALAWIAARLLARRDLLL